MIAGSIGVVDALVCATDFLFQWSAASDTIGFLYPIIIVAIAIPSVVVLVKGLRRFSRGDDEPTTSRRPPSK